MSIDTAITPPASETLTSNDPNVVTPWAHLHLSFKGDKASFIAAAYEGLSYWYPRCAADKVKMYVIVPGAELTDGMIINIVTTEKKVGTKNMLGAYWNTTECYYWDRSDSGHQDWRVTAVHPSADKKIRYGDKVLLTNEKWSQRLVPDGNGYLTTKKDETNQNYWIFEKI